MNFKNTLLALSLFACTATATSIAIETPSQIALHQERQPHESRWGTYKTMATGALIGGSMGAINYATDGVFPWNWLFLSILRNQAIDDIAQDAHNQSVSVNHSLLASTAWITDWAAYILLHDLKL